MRRVTSVAACVAILLFASTGTAWAAGPRGPGGHHHGHHARFNGPNVRHWNRAYRGPRYPFVYPPVVYNPYGAYVPNYGSYGTYGNYGSQFGFSVGSPNFSLWYAQ